MEVREVAFTPQGFDGDRQLMLIDDVGRMVTLREYPALAGFTLREKGEHIFVGKRGVTDFIQIPVAGPAKGDAEPVGVLIHDLPSRMVLTNKGYDRFFSEVLKKPVRLARSVPWLPRIRHREEIRRDVPLYAQDGYPIMMLSTESMNDLNIRLESNGKPMVGPERFRPNVLIEGTDERPHAEDHLDTCWLGSEGYPFKRLALCSRCRAITVHDRPTSASFAAFDPDNEPMKTLLGYRRMRRAKNDGKVYFGVNAISPESGTLSVGMEAIL